MPTIHPAKVLHVFLMAGLLLTLVACGGGGGSNQAPTVPSDATAGSGPSNEVSDDADDEWVPGQFEPAENFEDQCAEPRMDIDPQTGRPFPDQQGTFIDENNWLRSWSHDLYLWFDEIMDRNPADFDTSEYFDLLKTEQKTPSGNPKDRFHFSLSTEEWRALSQSGVSAGYGVQWAVISPSPPRQVVVAYIKAPNSPATTDEASLARGTEVLEVDGVDVVNDSGQDSVNIINAALFPSDVGQAHEFTVRDHGASETRMFTMESVDVTSDPVQNVGTVDTINGRVGYMLFTDHIAPSEAELIDAVEQLRDASIADLVLDIRYNGGGFLDIASELAFMVAGEEATVGRTFELMEFNEKHPDFNPVTGQRLEPAPFHSRSRGFSVPAGTPLPSLNLDRVFVLTGPGTCSASESIMNSLRGIDIEVIQMGSTTCGKPFGFFPTDNCGTTYFSIQFRGINEKGFGGYADGFSPVNLDPFEGTEVPGCAVLDDFTHALGDPDEARFSAALEWRENQSCPGDDASVGIQRAATSSNQEPLSATDGDTPKSLWFENRMMNR